ncbi:MAG: hypothetical protein MRY21_02830 [Simkaniaceae bacterium]|nr:hypothetical protein [Simkaniaceae bacterium]
MDPFIVRDDEVHFDKQLHIKDLHKVCHGIPFPYRHYRVNLDYCHPDWKSQFEISLAKGLIDDPTFLHHFRNSIHPIQKPKRMELPKGRISVAVHIRKGGGIDNPLKSEQIYHLPPLPSSELSRIRRPFEEADLGEPLKFPPEQYYIDQIYRISEYFNHAPLYVHIFTDEKETQALLSRIKGALRLENVTWGIRDRGNGPKRHILDDLYAMTQFDCLIRSASNFSQIAQLLKDYSVVIYPIDWGWFQDRFLVIDHTEMVIDGAYSFPKPICNPKLRWRKI